MFFMGIWRAATAAELCFLLKRRQKSVINQHSLPWSVTGWKQTIEEFVDDEYVLFCFRRCQGRNIIIRNDGDIVWRGILAQSKMADIWENQQIIKMTAE